MPCVYHASPPGKAHWLHAGALIGSSSGRVRQLEKNNELQISTVRDDDQGIYLCIAENDWGTANRELELVVLGVQLLCNLNNGFRCSQTECESQSVSSLLAETRFRQLLV
jgi:hypothetical protein